MEEPFKYLPLELGILYFTQDREMSTDHNNTIPVRKTPPGKYGRALHYI